jgi:hypothetical protein
MTYLSLPGWITISASPYAGWIAIIAVTLNALGVLTLFSFQPESIGGYRSLQLLDDLAERNRRRVPWRGVGYVLIGLSWLLQVIAVLLNSKS